MDDTESEHGLEAKPEGRWQGGAEGQRSKMETIDTTQSITHPRRAALWVGYLRVSGAQCKLQC